MTTDTSTVAVGENARFSIGVKNNGPGPASGVLVTDTLPASLRMSSISASQGSCSGSSCSIGSIAQGGSASMSVTTRAIAVGKVVNSASVSQSLPDPVPANGTASATVDVVSNAPPPPADTLPPPTPTEVNVAPTTGDGQCVALKGGGGCKPLDAGQHVDISDIAYVDPGKGKVQIDSIVGVGNFYGGKFSLTPLNKPAARRVSGRAADEADPRGESRRQLQPVSTKSRSVSSAAASKPVRRLWGKGKGRFRTKGRYASGTVRGTNWLTEDFCSGTQIRVVAGIVQVDDLVLKKTIMVHPGHKYFAKAPKTK